LKAEVCVAEAAVSFKPAEETSLHWLALNLTPGLGPTKGRKLVEHFGGIKNVFKATLTELEATGIHTVSAQSLGTGRSVELAYEELGRAATAGIGVVCFDDAAYPLQAETNLRSSADSLFAG
jgi:predicted Rossmann fold nucleotide-binding protein DprA/Smf involved in DNA uptake